MAAQIGAILLAAGSSRRMGAANKLLLPVRGVPMVARVAATIGEAGLPLLVVLGHEADAVRAALSPSPANAGEGVACPIFLVAPDHARGIGHTLAAGVLAAPSAWSGALVCLGDMPFVGADLLRRLATALDGPHAAVVPVHAGRRGNPVGWGRAWFERLAASVGDTGGRALLDRARPREVPADETIFHDVDTPADAAALALGPIPH